MTIMTSIIESLTNVAISSFQRKIKNVFNIFSTTYLKCTNFGNDKRISKVIIDPEFQSNTYKKNNNALKNRFYSQPINGILCPEFNNEVAFISVRLIVYTL